MRSDSISALFAKYFQVVLSDSAALRDEVYRIRYEVYCREFGYERADEFPDGMERDEFDGDRSRYCVLMHRETGMYAGCVRLVLNDTENVVSRLPFENAFDGHLIQDRVDSILKQRHLVGEISRLAVPSGFRRRNGDSESPIGALTHRHVGNTEMRCFPHIPVGLYLAAAAIVLERNMDGAFAIMEPRLVRHMQRLGIVFDPFGDTLDYHGKRAPYFIHKRDLYRHLKPPIRSLLDVIMGDISSCHLKAGAL